MGIRLAVSPSHSYSHSVYGIQRGLFRGAPAMRSAPSPGPKRNGAGLQIEGTIVWRTTVSPTNVVGALVRIAAVGLAAHGRSGVTRASSAGHTGALARRRASLKRRATSRALARPTPSRTGPAGDFVVGLMSRKWPGARSRNASPSEDRAIRGRLGLSSWSLGIEFPGAAEVVSAKVSAEDAGDGTSDARRRRNFEMHGTMA